MHSPESLPPDCAAQRLAALVLFPTPILVRWQHTPHYQFCIMSDSDDAEAMIAVAMAFSNDDDDDIATAFLAVEHHEYLLSSMIEGSEGTGRRGSLPGRWPNKLRCFAHGERGIVRDNFDLAGRPPIYDEKDFERRFRLPRIIFDRVYRDILSVPYFQKRVNATGEMQSSTRQKVAAALHVLAYGSPADEVEEYARLEDSTINEIVHRFTRFVIEKYKHLYLREPTRADLQRIMDEYAGAVFLGCMGCVDCSHWVWKIHPVAFHGKYQSKSKKSSIVMETAADKDMYLWHFYIGLRGTMNDFNVTAVSPFSNSMTSGSLPPPIPCTVNGVERTLPYVLCDGIYLFGRSS